MHYHKVTGHEQDNASNKERAHNNQLQYVFVFGSIGAIALQICNNKDNNNFQKLEKNTFLTTATKLTSAILRGTNAFHDS